MTYASTALPSALPSTPPAGRPAAGPSRAATARYAAARDTYATGAVQTATPAQLVVMVYDGVLRHLDVASLAIEQGDLALANDRLTKSQALLFELEAGLDVDAWAGGRGLADLYRFIGNELVTANVTKDTARIAACRELLAPLAEAWRTAARAPLGGPA